MTYLPLIKLVWATFGLNFCLSPDNKKEDFQWTLKKVTAAHIVAKTNPPIEDPMLVSCAAKEFFPLLMGVNCLEGSVTEAAKASG